MDIQIYSDSAGRVPLVQWLEGLADRQGRAAIKARLLRLQAGNFGDCKPLRAGVQELRIDKGPGYRVYLSRQGPVLVLPAVWQRQNRPRPRHCAGHQVSGRLEERGRA